MDLNVKSVFNTIRLYVPGSLGTGWAFRRRVHLLTDKLTLPQIRAAPAEERDNRGTVASHSHSFRCRTRRRLTGRQCDVWVLGF